MYLENSYEIPVHIIGFSRIPKRGVGPGVALVRKTTMIRNPTTLTIATTNPTLGITPLSVPV